MFAEHGFELAGMAEAELAQQRSHGRGRVDVAEQMLHAARAQQVDIVDAVGAGAHPGDQGEQFRARVRCPGRDLRGGDRNLLGEQVRQAGVFGQGHDRDQSGARDEVVLVEHGGAVDELVGHFHRKCLS